MPSTLRAMSDGPLAYFLTFSTYGTHLHGDQRGSVHHGSTGFGEPGMEVSPQWQEWDESRLRNAPQKLDAPRREIALQAIARVATLRGWRLWTVNVRTNHIHLVLSAPGRPEPVLTSLKGWITKDLIEAGLLVKGEKLWTRHGSTRYLWNEASVEAACRYVRDGQGADIPGSVLESRD